MYLIVVLTVLRLFELLSSSLCGDGVYWVLPQCWDNVLTVMKDALLCRRWLLTCLFLCWKDCFVHVNIIYISISSGVSTPSKHKWTARKRLKGSELKVLSSQTCWEMQEHWEQTCHSRLRKSRAPIFRAVLCDNLLCFSCAPTQNPPFWIGAV